MSSREMVFVALGGLGEIGMNAALYGVGEGKRRQWLLVDLGVSFAGEDVPGVDLVLPDLSFIEAERRNLVGIVITHAHEDHFGALAELWPKLGVPVYMTRFAAGLLEARRLREPGAPKIPVKIVAQSSRHMIGPFDVEFVPVAHSIPEATALAIRTDAGLVVHSGDWKTDATPVIGVPTDEKRLREIGDEGVAALIADSTNIFREGVSASEAEVAANLKELILASPARVAVTTFASNVARLRAVGEAAQAAGREVVVVGRAMDRVIDVARELGMLDGLKAFRGPDAYGYLPRDKVVALLTGSQGEPRAALARIAANEHPDIALASGDRVIFSSRTIPGNEKPVGVIVNALARQGIEVVTDRTHLVHVSGHPWRGEVSQLLSWLKPHLLVPAHGEAAHLTEHAAFAKQQGVPNVQRAFNGEMVRLTGTPGIIEKVKSGRIYKDGDLLVDSSDRVIGERRKLAFAGVVSVAIAMDEQGRLAGDPEIGIIGLPTKTDDGETMEAFLLDTIEDIIETLPKGKRRDPEAVRDIAVRGLRGAIAEIWNKKPLCQVLVVQV